MPGFQFDFEVDEGERDFISYTLTNVSEEPVIFYRPTPGQLANFASAFSEDASFPDQMAAIKRFFRNITDEEGYDVILDVIEDPRMKDAVGALVQLQREIVERFTKNPTKRPSDYLPPQSSGGRSSTATRRVTASTRSRSPRAGSAT